MPIRQLHNPFGNIKVDDTVRLPAGDVPELHARVLDQCGAALQAARQLGSATSLLVIGEAGSGKSHMIAQLRKPMLSDPRALLVPIRLHGASSGRLWRHIRERLVSELLLKHANSVNGENGLLRLLRNRFPTWLAAGNHSLFLTLLTGKQNASDSLRTLLDEFARSSPAFDYKLRKVMPYLVHDEHTTLAHDWLRGHLLADDDLKRLGLPPDYPTEIEHEQNARRVVLSLLQLAGDTTAMFLFFDELEAIQASNNDEGVLREFANIATELLSESGIRVIATSIRPNLHIALRKAVEVSNLQKLTQFTAQIPALTWEQVVRITRCRLEAEDTCRQTRQREAPDDPDWPIGRGFLDRTFKENRLALTPRHLIRACDTEFRRLQTGQSEPSSTSAPGGSPPAKEVVADDELARMWEKQRKKYQERPRSIQFENVFSLALPWLVGLGDATLVRVKDVDPRLGDINLIFQPKASGQKAIAISYCNHDPRLLWRRLDRLLTQWAATRRTLIARLILLRPAAATTTKGALARFESLSQAGVRVLQIDDQQLVELTAFQVLLTATLKGEMTRAGKPVDAQTYDDWTKANLSDAVKELLVQIFEPAEKESAAPTAAKKPTARRKAVQA